MNPASNTAARLLSQVRFNQILAFTVIFVAAQAFFLMHNFVENVDSAQANAFVQRIQTDLVTREINEIKPLVQEISEKRGKIDPLLPTLSTTELDLLEERLFYDVARQEFEQVKVTLKEMSALIDLVLDNQEEIAVIELERLRSVVEANVAELDLILGDTSGVPSDYLDTLTLDSVYIMDRLQLAREMVEFTSGAIRERRAEIGEATKQIVIQKSTLTLTMYEDGDEIFSMPVSLGKVGAQTRSGDFEILDKLGTVWSYWEIWLPYWMGIYYAGASENGIHGLPYDNAGRVYWANDIGVRNVTYGCVMPYDHDVEKLYEWADVGTPVAIVW